MASFNPLTLNLTAIKIKVWLFSNATGNSQHSFCLGLEGLLEYMSLPLTSHLSPLNPHPSPLTPQLSARTSQSHLTPHLSPLTSHRSPLTSHLSPLTHRPSPLTGFILLDPQNKNVVIQRTLGSSLSL